MEMEMGIEMGMDGEVATLLQLSCDRAGFPYVQGIRFVGGDRGDHKMT